jgi:hypothetical protein
MTGVMTLQEALTEYHPEYRERKLEYNPNPVTKDETSSDFRHSQVALSEVEGIWSRGAIK